MATFKRHFENRSSSPSSAGLLRRHRSADSEEAHSPWRRHPTWCAGGGKVGWEGPSSFSPFERSGRTTTTAHQIYRKVAPAGDDHVTHGRGGGNDDEDDNDDDWMCDDDAFDGEDGEELRKEEVRKSSWLRGFLAWLGEMKPEEVTDPAARTLCPACKGGPGGTVWYRGFRALLDHARTVRTKRVMLHRRFAEILEEELRNRSGRSTGEGGAPEDATAPEDKWQGLASTDDRMIPWPPMVVVLNTRLGKQEGSDKWLGMGNGDLLEYFKEYEPVKARSAYDSHGHRGASLLIFNNSVLGYHQAQRLHNHFKQEGRGKYEWHKEKPWKQETNERRLVYGHMVTKEEELNTFSPHYGDKQKLKYEMKPYRMMVGDPLKEMLGSIGKLASLERDIAKEIERNNDLDGKLRQRDLEIEATRRKLSEQFVEHNEEIESLNEYCERLCGKLKKSEMAREEMQKQFGSSPRSAGADQGEASGSKAELGNQMNHGDGERDSTDDETDGRAEEKLYLGTCDSGNKKKESPLLRAVV